MHIKTLSPIRFISASLFAAMLALCFTACDTEGFAPEVAEQLATVDVIGEALGFTTEEFTYETAEIDESLARHGRNDRRRIHRYIRNNCFRLVFPVTLNFPDSTTAVADSAQALRELLHDWRENHNPSEGRPRIATPFDVMLADSTIATINGRDDLRAILADCRPDRPRPNPWRNRCFRLEFPVTIQFPDSTEAVADSAREMRMLFREWRANHDPSEGRPRIAFPYDVRLRDSSVVTINNRAQLERLIGACRDRIRPSIFGVRNCFRLKYPVIVRLPDGTFSLAENQQDIREILSNWEQCNDDTMGHPTLVFPYKVQLRNGRVVTIDNRREQRSLLQRCGDRRPGDGPGGNPGGGSGGNGG